MVLELTIFKCFSPYMTMAAILFSGAKPFEQGSLKDSYIPPLQNDNGAASKFKAQTGGLQLWPWVCIVELWILHIISLRRTFDPNLINIFQRVQEIWSEHEIQGSNLWPLTVTLTLNRHPWVMVLHIASLRQTFDQSFMKIFQRVQEIWSEQEKRWMTFNCHLDLESASLSYRFYTSSH